jgi:hypothetical protein
MIHCVCWKWGKKYTTKHVSVLQSMLKRHLTLPHELVCITDDPPSLPEGVRPYPIPRDIPQNPKKPHNKPRVRKCIRRMWLYSKEAAAIGSRLLQLDVDIVITGNIDKIVDRPEDFVIWKCGSAFGQKWAYNATVMLLTAGARRDVWEQWKNDPVAAINAADRAGLNPYVNSDQAIATLFLEKNPPATWTTDDGIYAYREIAGKFGKKCEHLPADSKIVSFHGNPKNSKVARDPSNAALYELSPWIKEYWR